MVLSAVLPEQVEQVGFYLRKIFRCLDRDLAFLLSQEGLTLPQMIVLRQVQVQNDTTLAELTENCNGQPVRYQGLSSAWNVTAFFGDSRTLPIYAFIVCKLQTKPKSC